MTSLEKLEARLNNGKHICVGLDSDRNKIPDRLRDDPDGVFLFNQEIVENTKDEVCAYKINLAFYENEGMRGYEALEKTMDILPDDVLIIGDAKRGDIGNTSKMYAKSVFDHFGFDSITLHPYMGFDSLSPFLEYKDKIHFVLALTSNPGSADFEKLELAGGRFLYQEVIRKCSNWNTAANIGIVFGATNPDELKNEISNFNSLFVLLPGIGAQGGSLEDVVSAFKSAGNNKFIINVSRAVIYAENSIRFAEAAYDKLIEYNNEITKLYTV